MKAVDKILVGYVMENKYINRAWNGNKSRYTLEQLKSGIPSSMLKYAQRIATGEERELTKEDCNLLFREPSGEVNLNGVIEAINQVRGLFGPSPVERATAIAELESHRRKAEAALGTKAKYESGLSELNSLADSCFSSMVEVSQSAPLEKYTALDRLVAEDQILNRDVINSDPTKGVLIEVPEEMVAHLPEGAVQEDSKFQTPDSSQRGGFRVQNLNGLGGLEVGGLPSFPNGIGLSPKALSKRMEVIRSRGVVENDFRSLPNFEALGIKRAAGPATQDELKAFVGQTRPDGSPITGDDFLSVGAVLANIDIIPHLMAFISPTELGRLGAILSVRSKKSDQDHSREVLSGNFTVINPAIGQDPDAKMNADHPMLGEVPYTALTARLLFPIMQNDSAQAAAVESVRRGRIQNLSIAFGYRGIACGLCGEMPTNKILVSNGNIIGFTIDPEKNEDMCSARGDDDEYYYPMSGVLRTPVNIEGGFMYRTVTILKANPDGTIQIDPIPQESLEVGSGTVFMTNMRGFYGYTFCRLHGLMGNTLKDGRKTVGMFTEMRALINVAAVDQGAIADARLVLDPAVNY